MIYEIKKDESGTVTLMINGVEATCPYKPDLLLPGQNALGQMQMSIVKQTCSTNCPFADYIKTENIHQYSIECTGIFKAFDIEEETEIKTPKLLAI
jgi:hypothetical protein